MDNENKNSFEEEMNENPQTTEETTVEETVAEGAENVNAEEASVRAEEEPVFSPDEEVIPVEEEPAKEDFFAPMDGDGSMPGGMMFEDDGPTALYMDDDSVAMVQPPKKSNMAVFAVLGVIIVALLIVIAVLLVGNKPDFLNFNSFKEVSVGSVNGEKVTEGQIRIFMAQEENTMLIQGIQEQFGDSWQTMDQAALMDAINNFDWNKLNSDGETYAQVVKDSAFDQVVLVNAKAAKAEEMGIGLTESEKQQMTSGVSQMKAQYPSEEEFIKMLNENYFKDEQSYLDFFLKYQTAMNFDSEYQKDPSKFLDDETALASYINDNTASVKHILVKTVDDSNQPLPEDQIAAARAKAEEALSRAKAGEDFDALIDEYNQDPGQMQNKAGYAFGKGEMMPAFEAASFALGINEISELVETDYGYHIIKRIVGLSEVQQRLIKEAKVKKNAKALNKLKLTSELQKEAQAAAATASASPSASPAN